MEKIKDFIYETSDILLGLIVLALIIFVFTYELKEFFSFDMIVPLSASVESDEITATEKPVSENKPITASESKSKPSDPAPSTEPNSTEQNIPSETIPSEDSTNASGEGIQEEPIPQTIEQTEQTQQDPSLTSNSSSFKITIPSGSSSDMIADLLYKNNVIHSQQEFLNYIISKKMDTKLKAGTFTIPQGSSLEEVIRILTQ